MPLEDIIQGFVKRIYMELKPVREIHRLVGSLPGNSQQYINACEDLAKQYESMPDTINEFCYKPKVEMGEHGKPTLTGIEPSTCPTPNVAKFEVLMTALKMGCAWAEIESRKEK